jgi:hypothetical protein
MKATEIQTHQKTLTTKSTFWESSLKKLRANPLISLALWLISFPHSILFLALDKHRMIFNIEEFSHIRSHFTSFCFWPQDKTDPKH